MDLFHSSGCLSFGSRGLISGYVCTPDYVRAEIMGSHDMSCVKEPNVAQLCEVKDNTSNVPC